MDMEKTNTKVTWQSEMLTEVNHLSEDHVYRWATVIERLGVPEDIRKHWTATFINEMQNLFVQLYQDLEERERDKLNGIQNLKKRILEICYTMGTPAVTFTTIESSLYHEEQKLKSYIVELEKKLALKQEEVETLKSRQEKICITLGKVPKPVSNNPLPTSDEILDLLVYVESLEDECFLREEKYTSTQSILQQIALEIDYKPVNEFEERVIYPSSVPFDVTDKNMLLLSTFRLTLESQADHVKAEVAIFYEKIKQLWQTLNEDEQYRKNFVMVHTGYSVKTSNALKEEIKRLEILKRQNIETLIKRLRFQVQVFWDKCRFTSKQRAEFICYNDDVYTENMLNIFQGEVLRLTKYYEDNKVLYESLVKYEESYKKLNELDAPKTGSDRMKNRGGQLLLEEKERKLTKKRIDKLEPLILQLAEEYIQLQRTEFLFDGKNVNEFMKGFQEVREDVKILKVSSTNKSTINSAKSANTLTSHSAVKVPKPLHPHNNHHPTKLKSEKVKGPRSAPPKIHINTGRIQSISNRLKKKEIIPNLKDRSKIVMDLLRVDHNDAIVNYSHFEAITDTTMPALVAHDKWSALGTNSDKRSTQMFNKDFDSPLALPLLETPNTSPKDKENSDKTPVVHNGSITMRRTRGRMFRDVDDELI